jgi:predicted enzyme related to lactoylglutathione lyase
VNYTVDDMDAIVARLKAKGVEILKRDDSDDYGRFTWVLDPEGNKVELWEPKRAKPASP